jgi:hypothetical protein
MTFIAAAAIGSVALGAYKTINGANQTAKANRLAKSNIFTPEEMPYEVGLGTDLAARNYTNGMPGTANAVNNINRNAATQFYRGQQGATSGGDILDLATRIGQGTNMATNQLGAQEAQYKSGALNQYEGALNNQANWQKQLYNNNTLQPYLRTANLASSMYGAGQQNMYSGLDDIGSSVVGAASAFGANNKPPQSTFFNPNTSPLQASGGTYTSSYPDQQITPYQIPNSL